ncbi:TIGR04282 family arsenosugar biosynthesis glycosyltransferase [Salinimicrobium soli]|uniref:TIGR04282 family arsenosugar biosynthesis glycosyltransferase n=1 Tax=Salinimicrobium soli TaxID=1254399 RepID=UPI003AB022B3
MPQKKELLLIFTRNLEIGRVKKRLAKKVGNTAALEVYRYLLKHTQEITKDLDCDKTVYYSEEIPTNDLWEEKEYQKMIQLGKDLGERMENAFKRAFSEGYSKVVIIGSDLFDLQEKDLKKAFLALQEKNYVLGPAQDGGYYLLGMTKMNSKVFRNKDWSTPAVFEQTLNDLKEENVALLEVRNDIDTFEDMRQHQVLLELVDNLKERS